MKLAKVIGTVVATVKDPSINNCKILWIQPLNDDKEAEGNAIAAIDTVQAGPNEIVWYTLSREAALACPDTFCPVDAAITGIVDQVNNKNDGIHNRDKIFIGGEK